MKQMAFMLLATFLGVTGSFTMSPVWGLAVYYLYAVMRPAFIWQWTDAMGVMIGDVQWSLFVAVAALASTALWRVGLLPVANAKPWYGNPKFTRSHYLFFAFVVWICVTYFTAVSQDTAWPFFLEYIKIFTMFTCAALVLRTVRDLWVVYYVVIIGAGYAAYEINAYYFLDGYMFVYLQGYGGLDNNGAALIVAMLVPLAYFAWEGTSHWTRWGFLLCCPLGVHAVMLSFSRGGMLSLAVAAVLVWFRSRHKWFLTVVYVIGLVGVIGASGKELSDRFFSISKADADASAQSRLTSWKIAIRMANERPLVGFGIRCSNLYTHAYGADMEGRTIHSQYLQTAADSGWVALALYAALLGSAFLGLRRVRTFLRKYPDPESLRVKSLASGLECTMVLFCFGAVFLSLEHFEMPYVVILLAVQLHAITLAVAKHHDRVPPRAGPGPAPAPPSPAPVAGTT